jgi:hypothetical protein
MKSNLLLYSVILVLVVQGAKSVLQLDSGFCDDIALEVNTALRQAVDIADCAYN